MGSAQCTNPGKTNIPIEFMTSQINPEMGISITCLGDWIHMIFKIISISSPGVSCMMCVVSSCLKINIFQKYILLNLLTYNQNLEKLTSS